MTARPGRRTLVLPAAITMAIAMVPATAFAQTAPTYAQLLQNAENAPQLAEAAANVARAQGRAEQARARPNPSISLLTENVIGTAPYSGLGRAETTVQYNHPIELGGKRRARIAAGEAGVSAAEARSRDTRIAFAYELARAYAAAEIAERRVGLAEDELEEAEVAGEGDAWDGDDGERAGLGRDDGEHDGPPGHGAVGEEVLAERGFGSALLAELQAEARDGDEIDDDQAEVKGVQMLGCGHEEV